METLTTMSFPELASAHSSPDEHEEYYKSDKFRMTSMKVLPCSKRFVHDWTECPFAHPQEKATRRDPRTHTYTGIACPSMKKEGLCAFADHCPYAHNVFEYWLHPTRYRTQLCNDGSNCRRKICFFAHSLDELRVPTCKPFVSPEALATAAAAAAAETEIKHTSGLVGSPIANLDVQASPPPRISMDSIRQSLDWGPVPMPSNTTHAVPSSSSTSIEDLSPTELSISPPPPPPPLSVTQRSGSSSSGSEHIVGTASPTAVEEQQQQQQPSSPSYSFTAQEQHVIETVSHMLATDKISPPQAATILQHMLPEACLQVLQSHLNIIPSSMMISPPSPSPSSSPSLPSPMKSGGGHGGDASTSARHLQHHHHHHHHQQQQQQYQQSSLYTTTNPYDAPSISSPTATQPYSTTTPSSLSSSAAAAYDYGVIGNGAVPSAARASIESDRSSFDVARMSLDSRVSSEYTPSSSRSFDMSCPPGMMTSAHGGQGQYMAPAPAYPQYWTSSSTSMAAAAAPGMSDNNNNNNNTPSATAMPLSPVLEGIPMYHHHQFHYHEHDADDDNADDDGNGNANIGGTAAMLPDDFNRLSFENSPALQHHMNMKKMSTMAMNCQAPLQSPCAIPCASRDEDVAEQNWAKVASSGSAAKKSSPPPTVVNPFISSFFTGEM